MAFFCTLNKYLMLILSLFEFLSAYNWWTNPTQEIAATDGLITPMRGAGTELFVASFVLYLLTLALVRMSVFLQPTSKSTLFIVIAVHVLEQAFWWFEALQPQYAKGATAQEIFTDVLGMKRGLFASIVLLAPTFIIVTNLLAFLTAPSTETVTFKAKIN
eukprot:m.29950 g.29950  ORF g.29950 m.29950 type:complete len:160 (+) comp16186_c0_seq1:29-508(+)